MNIIIEKPLIHHENKSVLIMTDKSHKMKMVAESVSLMMKICIILKILKNDDVIYYHLKKHVQKTGCQYAEKIEIPIQIDVS